MRGARETKWRRLGWRAVLIAAAMLVSATAVADARAALRSELQRDHELRFELDGKALTLTIVDLPNVTRSPSIESEMVGRRLRVACGTSFQPTPKTVVVKVLRWPDHADAITAHFRRDISRRARWCLIEAADGGFRGGDVAFVSFRDAEPGRRLTSGRFPDGELWRLAAWRGERYEPCLSLRGWFGAFSTCAIQMAEVDRGLKGTGFIDPCSRGMLVLGAVERAAVRVDLRLADRSLVAAKLLRPPRGSRVQAQYFVASFDEPVDVELASAYDAEGRVLARDDGIGGGGPYPCPSHLRDTPKVAAWSR